MTIYGTATSAREHDLEDLRAALHGLLFPARQDDILAAWHDLLGPTRIRQLREALTALRDITDPFLRSQT